MNIDLIKSEIEKNIGKKVKITVNGMRNRCSSYIGSISECYPYIFTVSIDGDAKSFSYAEVITGEVEISYM